MESYSLREIWKYDRAEVGLSVITTLGVVAVGAINGILIAVALALRGSSDRPRDLATRCWAGWTGCLAFIQ